MGRGTRTRQRGRTRRRADAGRGDEHQGQREGKRTLEGLSWGGRTDTLEAVRARVGCSITGLLLQNISQLSPMQGQGGKQTGEGL